MMPSRSKAQHNFMAAVAHSPSFAKKAEVPMSVGKEFNAADKVRTFKQGGVMATKGMNLFKGKETYGEELKEAKAIKSGKITPQQYARGEKMEQTKKMANGGSVYSKFPTVSGGKLPRTNDNKFNSVKGSSLKSGLDHDNTSGDGIARKGKTRGDNIVMMASGGVAKAMPKPKAMGSMGMARGGGIEQRGKTRGMMMKNGGKC